MKSRIIYQPQYGNCWLVEYKEPGLFGGWVQSDRFKDKNDALKLAQNFIGAGVIWTSDSQASESSEHG